MKIQFFKIIVVIIWDSKRIQAAKNSCAVQTRLDASLYFEDSIWNHALKYFANKDAIVYNY